MSRGATRASASTSIRPKRRVYVRAHNSNDIAPAVILLAYAAPGKRNSGPLNRSTTSPFLTFWERHRPELKAVSTVCSYSFFARVVGVDFNDR